LKKLGPERSTAPLDKSAFAQSAERSRQAIKINCWIKRSLPASATSTRVEALFRARIPAAITGVSVSASQVARLWRANSQGVGGHRLRQHRAVEFWREQVGQTFLFGRAAGGAPDY